MEKFHKYKETKIKKGRILKMSMEKKVTYSVVQ